MSSQIDSQKTSQNFYKNHPVSVFESKHFNNSEVLYVKTKKVSCEGSQVSSTHPLVYLNMGEKDFVNCPYCSKLFTTK
jgi:uncharacterized Zn-finger protein